MVSPPSPFAAALEHQRAGRLREAEPLLRQTVKEQPLHGEAWARLGEVCQGLGRSDAAAEAFRQMLRLQPDNAMAQNNLGVVLLGQKKHAEARAAFEEALLRRPDYADAHSNRGIVLMLLGELSSAESSFRRALELRPSHADAWNNLGLVLGRLSRPEEALAAFQEAVRLNPHLARAKANLAHALRALGRPMEAAAAYEQALQGKAADAELHQDRGALLLGRRQFTEAAQHFREAIALQPTAPAAHNSLGMVLLELGEPGPALASFDEALRLRPDDPSALFNRGLALSQLGRPDEALACTRQALRLRPHYPEALNSLANVLREQGRIAESLAYYRRALELLPGQPVIASNLLFALQYAPGLTPEAIWEEHHQYGQRAVPGPCPPPPALPREGRCLRLGYVSPDFRDHVVGAFAEMVIGAHDAQGFEIVCYADVPRPDGVTQRIRAACHRWVDITGQSDKVAADQIRADQVDILIDLAGHTGNNRLPVFAQRVAPVQATLYGYPGTTGLPTVDYRITDRFLDPPGLTEGFYSERIIRVADVLWCYRGGPELDPGPPPVRQREHITFGVLNNPTKITAERIALWAEIMEAVPRSRMVLLGGAGKDGVDWLLDVFALNGIEARRLTVIGRRGREDYFRLYQEMDLCLDTFPYTGCNTTADALWMGVPVVTQVDRWSVTRQGVAPLTLVDLGELITDSAAAYVAAAVRLAGDIAKLAGWRRELRERLRRSPFMDAVRYARNLEEVCLRMWAEACARTGA